jgi:tetratricopeptide (TPR) repeat protein
MVRIPYFRSILCSILCSFVAVGDSKKKEAYKHEAITVAAQRLGQIVEREQLFLTNSSSPNKPLSEQELTRRAQQILSAYESYLEDNPRDVNGLILYGKFLRRMGQPRHATGLFLEADKIDPRLAVVKQNIANYLVEEGRLADALPFLLKAVELEPKEPVYHHQLGTFLFLFKEDLLSLGIASVQTNDRSMHEAFRTASKLAPDNFEYKLRYAQSFFDISDPDWDKALGVWQDLRNQARDRPVSEREYLALGEARAMTQLGRGKEAVTILKSITSPSLRATRESLIKELKESDATGKPSPKKSAEPKKRDNRNTQLSPLPSKFIDDNLRRLRHVSSRLEEEKLFRDLRADAIRADYDQNGQVRLRLTSFAEVEPVPSSIRNSDTQHR